ncbi:MAG: nuclear transport factor 2 family protein [Parvularculaceae bacterium]|nr:nuclear transport factor 2 family protein [Parvularculaceae bacterium]
MIRQLISSLAILGFVVVTACERADDPGVATVDPNVVIVQNLMKAYNAHDVDAMRGFFHDDVGWYEVYGGTITPVTLSAADLAGELETYFATFPNVTSSLENPTVSGNYVTAVEKPVWEVDGKRKSQSSIVVYEITDGKVKRFWYFPAL